MHQYQSKIPKIPLKILNPSYQGLILLILLPIAHNLLLIWSIKLHQDLLLIYQLLKDFSLDILLMPMPLSLHLLCL